MPSKATVMRWLASDEAFQDQYRVARETQADSLVDDMIDIADDSTLTPEDRRIRIWARQWSAGKMKPKRYGEKQQIEQNVNLTVATQEQRDAAVKAAMDANT